MIKNINAGPGIAVMHSAPSWPYFNNYNHNSVVGAVRYNGNAQHFEVYDGSLWQMISSSAPLIELDAQTKEVVDWARTKMIEEQKLIALAKKHPGLQEAYERLEIMKTLTLEEEMKNA